VAREPRHGAALGLARVVALTMLRRMTGALLSVFVSDPEEIPVIVDMPLQLGEEYVIGRAPLPEEQGVVVDAHGVSRRHVMLIVHRDSVEVRDLDSSYGTKRNGFPIEMIRVADHPTSLILGDARVLVTPPPRGDATEFRHERQITTASLRRILVILCRDHIIPPANRGAWVLTDEEISAVLGGKPNAGTVGKDLRNIADLVELKAPATRESIIDWAIASHEVSATDAHELDTFLASRGLGPYDDRIRFFGRSKRLRQNLRLSPDRL
jgi:hypothetical protein